MTYVDGRCIIASTDAQGGRDSASVMAQLKYMRDRFEASYDDKRAALIMVVVADDEVEDAARIIASNLDPRDDPNRRTRIEWRIVGRHHARGPWEGSWRTTHPLSTSNGRYEVKGYIRDGSEVWIERREVRESDVVREQVQIDDVVLS